MEFNMARSKPVVRKPAPKPAGARKPKPATPLARHRSRAPVPKPKPASKPAPKPTGKRKAAPMAKPMPAARGKQPPPKSISHKTAVRLGKKLQKSVDPLDITPTVDPFDITPTPVKIIPPYPGVYINEGLHTCIAYKRTENKVYTLMFSQNGGRVISDAFGTERFDKTWVRCHYPHRIGPVYPIERALKVFISPYCEYDDGAWRVLNKLAKGQDPDAEDSLDDILDPTPSKRPQTRRKRTVAAKLERKAKRQARLASMTPTALRAWRDKRNANRKIRRLKKKRENG